VIESEGGVINVVGGVGGMPVASGDF